MKLIMERAFCHCGFALILYGDLVQSCGAFAMAGALDFIRFRSVGPFFQGFGKAFMAALGQSVRHSTFRGASGSDQLDQVPVRPTSCSALRRWQSTGARRTRNGACGAIWLPKIMIFFARSLIRLVASLLHLDGCAVRMGGHRQVRSPNAGARIWVMSIIGVDVVEIPCRWDCRWSAWGCPSPDFRQSFGR